MQIEFRRAVADDLDILVKMRIAQLKEEGAEATFDLTSDLRRYYGSHLADGTFLAWAAADGEELIGVCGLSFAHKPPYYGNPGGKIGLVSNMYVTGAYRRQGIAKALLDRIVADARAFGCGVMQVTASDMGVMLYASYGFCKNGNFLQMTL